PRRLPARLCLHRRRRLLRHDVARRDGHLHPRRRLLHGLRLALLRPLARLRHGLDLLVLLVRHLCARALRRRPHHPVLELVPQRRHLHRRLLGRLHRHQLHARPLVRRARDVVLLHQGRHHCRLDPLRRVRQRRRRRRGLHRLQALAPAGALCRVHGRRRHGQVCRLLVRPHHRRLLLPGLRARRHRRRRVPRPGQERAARHPRHLLGHLLPLHRHRLLPRPARALGRRAPAVRRQGRERLAPRHRRPARRRQGPARHHQRRPPDRRPLGRQLQRLLGQPHPAGPRLRGPRAPVD
ncbi:hypothetical protein BN1708_018541, partial [Verticillium longisporum]